MIKTMPEEYIINGHDIDRDAFSRYAGPIVGELPKRGKFELIRPKI